MEKEAEEKREEEEDGPRSPDRRGSPVENRCARPAQKRKEPKEPPARRTR